MAEPDPETVVSVKAGESVYRPGDSGDCAFVIEQGTVVLLKEGGNPDTGARLGPGSVFGGTALARESSRASEARAETDLVLLRIARGTFAELVARFPEIAAELVAGLSKRCEGCGAERPAAPVVEEAAPAATARLVHSSGAEFPLPPDEEAIVGRPDPQKGFTPQVELSKMDAQRSLSRRHARLFREQGSYYVQEEPGVRNGTFINGRRLKGGERVAVKDGDEIAFGLIKTIFRLG